MKRNVSMVVAAFATVTLLGACADAGNISAPPDAPAADLSPEWDWSGVGIATGENPPCHPTPILPEGGEYVLSEKVAAEDGAVIAQGDQCLPSGDDPEPEATLSCPASVAWMQNVTCTVSANIGDLEVLQWSFDSNGSNRVYWSTNSKSWSGPMVISGTVTVQYMLDGQPGTESAQVTVNRRSGWSWASKVGGRRGSPGEIDECMSPGQAGLVSGQNCSASNPNALFTPARREDPGVFVAAMVSGTGPNGGLWYVQRADVDMQLIAQINRNYRSDGPVHSMVGDPAIVSACVGRFGGAFAQNIHTVNSLCSWEPEFHGLVQFAWDHEQRHLDAALPAARSPSNDLHRLLEPLVAQTEVSLRNAVRDRYDQAQDAIRAAALATHTGTPRTFHFWRFVNGQWGWAATTVFD